MRTQRVEKGVGCFTWPVEGVECVGLYPRERGAPEFEAVLVGGRKRESLDGFNARLIVAAPEQELREEDVRADGVCQLGSKLIEHCCGLVELAALEVHVEDVPQRGAPDRGERCRR